ncbi:MAG: hypothetical protein J2P27_08305 [Actinobacteria bacterium]|nr:hypothetical protein [Actinomycetota bacterium]
MAWWVAHRASSREGAVVVSPWLWMGSSPLCAGTAVTLLAEGNAAVYARPGITCIPVTGLEPARLAIAWRRGDRRACVREFIQACRDAASDLGLGVPEPEPAGNS